MKKTKILATRTSSGCAVHPLSDGTDDDLRFTVSDATGMRFSLENIREFFTPIYLNVFLKSLELALISTVLCLALRLPDGVSYQPHGAEKNATSF
jgi:ABC-type spermidine/putrescine transport system permease subunit II